MDIHIYVHFVDSVDLKARLDRIDSSLSGLYQRMGNIMATLADLQARGRHRNRRRNCAAQWPRASGRRPDAEPSSNRCAGGRHQRKDGRARGFDHQEHAESSGAAHGRRRAASVVRGV